MKRQHPAPGSHLPISLEIVHMLGAASLATGYQKEDWEIADTAIRAWMVHNSPDAIRHPRPSGYQWKEVFLPSGTLLRTVFGGRNHHCLVEEDQLIYESQAITPNQFIATVGGVRRSAWKSIWVLLPNASVWHLASSLRPVRAARLAP